MIDILIEMNDLLLVTTQFLLLLLLLLLLFLLFVVCRCVYVRADYLNEMWGWSVFVDVIG